MKQQGTIYKTMQGKEIEFDKLFMRNETTLAVGNVKVNARGDELGPGGKIIKRREDVMTEYNSHPDSVVHHNTYSKNEIRELNQEKVEETIPQTPQIPQHNNQKNKQPPLKTAIKDISDQDPTEELK